ncbi:RNA polymerase subunit sigma-70 [Streptomyces clavuligerus]|nr:RNA polymerase subunit sigma-70 [Streptomyces clavuligerus]ANW22254.1 RNA polymerase subunit sigma-70 [Streptomyces clavuligerus]AXU17149.1 sigma-70 family RNA polymerase sigma factor [Streptomyces clavuligerus]EDY47685.1 SigG [Streptomyces clavuligerus]MBY6307204.1 RNA polymerase subunit sigma-70 [Streptomyces clavuligerus]QCS10217.1 RNA polymerase subunit sigma-70 [Streptomyces clavuligerus]
MWSSAEDQRTAEAIRAGDQSAFGELAARHRHELHVHCYRMLGSFTEAEDMVQETLLRAWDKRTTFEGRSGFRAWLYRIATNACLDTLARRRRRTTAAVDSGGGPAASVAAEVTWLQPCPDRLLDLAAPAAAEPETAAIGRETIELAFLAAIQHLPPRQRAVLVLRDAAGLPAQETADTLEMSVPSVKSALQRARATLREHLPEKRTDWNAATGPTPAERALLDRYVAACRRSDLPALTALLHEDARQCMPPAHLVFSGREAILDMWRPVLEGEGSWGVWYSRTLEVNRQPAAVNYVRRPGAERYTAVNIDVLRIENGLITDITTFGPELLPAAGLSATLDPADLDPADPDPGM